MLHRLSNLVPRVLGSAIRRNACVRRQRIIVCTQIFTKQYSLTTSSFIGGYGLIMITSLFIYFATAYGWVIGSVRASRVIHNELISSVLSTTLRQV